MEKKIFCLIGCGYVAPKHFRAIKETGGELSAICEIAHTVVGAIDSYFPKCEFFKSEDEFQKFCLLNKPDYLVVCTPNYNHFDQIKFALQSGFNSISEKPLVIDPAQLDELSYLEKVSGKKVYSVLQLRLHKELLHLKRIVEQNKTINYDVNLRYVTPRGSWYFSDNWKSIDKLSGSILFNLGIHLFDACHFIFGNVHKAELHTFSQKKASGKLYLDRGNVNWFLSCDLNDVVENWPNRFIEVDNYKLNLDVGFTDLHTEVYQNVLNGVGYGVEECRPAIELISDMKNSFNGTTFIANPCKVDIIRAVI